jgi:glycosyltransferase involved in cell wall biosynthesis/predicted SAM-dependent methyltransferase
VLVSAFACHPEGASGLGGGEDIFGWNLAKQLARFHNVWVLTDERNRRGIEERLEEQPDPRLFFHYVNLPRWLRKMSRSHSGGVQIYAYLWQSKAYFAARRLNLQHRFHAFHHITFANDWMASYIGAFLPVPFLRGPGGGADRTPKGFAAEYRLRDRLWETFRSLAQRLLRRDPVFRLGQKRARAILVHNRESFEQVPAKYRAKVQIFQSLGLSSEDLAGGAAADRPRDKFRVISVGKLLHWKGFGLAIKAFKAFVGGLPPEARGNIGLTIVGEGPELGRLQHLVSELDLGTSVCFERWLPREELLSRLRSSDVFLYASLREGGGRVVVEAMAAGTPVVCLDLAGPGMNVADDCGIKVKAVSLAQTIRDLAAALTRLYQCEEVRLQMGRRARARVEQVHHWDRLGERMLEIYKQALGEELQPVRNPQLAKLPVPDTDVYESRWQPFVKRWLTNGRRRQIYLFDLVGFCALPAWPYFRMRSAMGAYEGAKINLGAGASRLPGWINTDINPLRRPDVWMDARRPWPFKSASLGGIATSHLLEHLFDEELAFLLKEAQRTLRPGGFLRVSVPDLDKAVREYSAAGPAPDPEPEARAERFQEICHWYGAHHQVFNFARLRRLLVTGAFLDVRQLPFPKSDFLSEQEAAEIDRHWEESLFVECTKPVDAAHR